MPKYRVIGRDIVLRSPVQLTDLSKKQLDARNHQLRKLESGAYEITDAAGVGFKRGEELGIEGLEMNRATEQLVEQIDRTKKAVAKEHLV